VFSPTDLHTFNHTHTHAPSLSLSLSALSLSSLSLFSLSPLSPHSHCQRLDAEQEAEGPTATEAEYIALGRAALSPEQAALCSDLDALMVVRGYVGGGVGTPRCRATPPYPPPYALTFLTFIHTCTCMCTHTHTHASHP
jgi:hypothetical protein